MTNPETPEFSSLGEAIRVLREKKELTLRALAEKVGVTAPFLSDLEHNRRKTDKLEAIANALGVPPQTLSSLDGRVPPALREWLEANPALVTVLKELQSSGQPVPLQLIRSAINQQLEK
jgi:transcriptional regulator with XRE-family HTH domain